MVCANQNNNTLSQSVHYRLQSLRDKLQAEGLQGIQILGINSKLWHARLKADVLQKSVDFPVFQSSPTNDIWSLLGGYEHDVFVYDR